MLHFVSPLFLKQNVQKWQLPQKRLTKEIQADAHKIRKRQKEKIVQKISFFSLGCDDSGAVININSSIKFHSRRKQYWIFLFHPMYFAFNFQSISICLAVLISEMVPKKYTQKVGGAAHAPTHIFGRGRADKEKVKCDTWQARDEKEKTRTFYYCCYCYNVVYYCYVQYIGRINGSF